MIKLKDILNEDNKSKFLKKYKSLYNLLDEVNKESLKHNSGACSSKREYRKNDDTMYINTIASTCYSKNIDNMGISFVYVDFNENTIQADNSYRAYKNYYSATFKMDDKTRKLALEIAKKLGRKEDTKKDKKRGFLGKKFFKK